MIYFLKEATFDDALLLFDWVNNKDVRLNSNYQNSITWDTHLKWFENRLNSNDTFIFILTDGEIDYGQIRIDNDNYNNWIIDYSIDVSYRGMGFGSLIVSLLIERFQYFYFKASVKKNNFSSIKVFSKLGFIEVNGNSTELIYFEKKQIHDK